MLCVQEDQDVMEADLDKDEVVRVQSGELYGDRLLNSYYVQASGGVKKKRVSMQKRTENVITLSFNYRIQVCLISY